MAALFFRAHGAKPNAYVYNPKLQSNQTEAKNLQPELLRGKTGVEKISTNMFDTGISGKNIEKVKQVRAGSKSSLNLVNTCEKTSQLSYKSRVLHSIMVVRACGVYSRGGSRNSHYFAYFCTYIHKNM